MPSPPNYTTITIFYGSSSNVAVALNGTDFSNYVQNVVRNGGFWNGSTFVPYSQVTSMVAS